jgi:hypothetical protein
MAIQSAPWNARNDGLAILAVTGRAHQALLISRHELSAYRTDSTLCLHPANSEQLAVFCLKGHSAAANLELPETR